jgi:hypothetical protein
MGDGGGDAKAGGEQHLHRDRGTFESKWGKQLLGWLGSCGETKKSLYQKQVIFLVSNEGFRCLIAVGDAPGHPVGSIVFGIPADPNTHAGNERTDPAMWKTYGPDNTPCRMEIKRNHSDLSVGLRRCHQRRRQKIWVGKELV